MEKYCFRAIAGGLFMALASTAAANESTYTDLDLDKCKTLASDDMGAIMLCSGYKDYQVLFAEGDLRQSVFYGPLDKKWQEQGFESFEPFNRVGTKIEWRLDGAGKPFAAILRWFLENVGPEGVPTDASTGQVLVVSRVAQPEDGQGCVVGYVDALSNQNANEMARKIADEEANNFACGHHKAGWHGKRGSKASEPTHVFPDGFPQQW